ncbi:MAG: response regulator [Candidatus Omnitrophota bacterium]
MKNMEEKNREELIILVVEDNIGLRRLIQKRLERERFSVEVVETGKEAIDRLRELSQKILLLDYRLPDMTGNELISKLIQEGHSVPFVIMTGHGDERTAVEMMKLGARDYLVKDHSLLEVLPQVMEQVFAQVMTEKKLSEVRIALKESEERFKMLFNSGTDAIFVLEVKGEVPGNFIEVNDVACTRLGYKRDELLQLTLKNIESIDDSEEDLFGKENLADKNFILYEAVQLTKDGDRICVENNARMFELNGKWVILCISRDITLRKQLEEQLRQAQKMEAIGKLAGGVAHDFNNLLTAIMGYSELLLVKMDENNPYRDVVEEIKKAGERAASLTQQLLAFSRKQMLKPRSVYLNRVVNGMEKMLKRIIGEDIQLISELAPNLHKIKADPGNLEQIILNLSVNAVDAMPSGGILKITTENKFIDDEFVKVIPTSQTGIYVCLSISDNGHGIDKKIIPHIFEPFFTTKKTGTGLGLSVVYGIIKQHNGWIHVESEPKGGSIFQIYFPALSIEEEEGAAKGVSLKEFQGNGERILLIEDEEGVRKVALKVLCDYGYTVREAGSATEALDVFEKENRDFALIVSDIVLPDRSGIDVTNDMTAINPGIKILLTSGYADQRAHWSEVLRRGIPFLQKPYSLGDLLKNVKEILYGVS